MVISVNGNLIDTKAIASISNISDEGYGYEFTITQFNNKNNICIHEQDSCASHKELMELRTNIIKIWLDNKLDVPTFNLKSYDKFNYTVNK